MLTVELAPQECETLLVLLKEEIEFCEYLIEFYEDGDAYSTASNYRQLLKHYQALLKKLDVA